MSLDSVAPDARIVLLAVPHPSSRRVAAYLQTVLAAGGRSIGCVLATSADRHLGPGETAIYLRPGAADIVELVVMADLAATPDLLAAHALVIDLDDRWRHGVTLSMERVIAEPEDALRMLSRHAGQPLDERVFTAAEEGIPALREDVAIYDHPLAFLAAVDRDVDGDKMLATEPPRTMLVLAGQAAAPIERPMPDAEDRIVTEMAVEDASLENLETLSAPQGLIHFHHVHGAPGLSELLERILPRLAPRGQLSGQESAAMAAEQVVAQLTLHYNHRGLVFLLSGRDWRAAPRSWWR